MRPTGTIQRETIPTSLYKAEGTFPGLIVDFAEDSNQNNVSDTRYILRWETLRDNRDRPRPFPFPPPSMLRVYTIKVIWNNTLTN